MLKQIFTRFSNSKNYFLGLRDKFQSRRHYRAFVDETPPPPPEIKILKPFLFWAGFSGLAFTSAAYLDRRHRAQGYSWREQVVRYVRDARARASYSSQSPSGLDRAARFFGIPTSFGPGEKAILGIGAINLAVFGLWQAAHLLARRSPTGTHWFYGAMARHFMHFSPANHVHTMITSMFSHSSLWHLGFNMLTLYSLGSYFANFATTGREHFWAIYLTGGLTSSLMSVLYQRSTGLIAPSLGASGAVYAVLAALATLAPDMKVRLMFAIELEIGTALQGLVGLDILGLILRWRRFDHAAHLGGALAGYLYAKYGHALWYRRDTYLRDVDRFFERK